MPNDAKKLLLNQSLEVSVQVTAARLKEAGVKLHGMGIQRKSVAQEAKLSPVLTKRLAGVK